MRSRFLALQKLSEYDLKNNASIEASWHQDYRNSAYIRASNLHYEINEGDVAVIFSQWGEIADILLMRDQKTGDSRGFAFIAYVDQRSTDLAVDNFNGSLVCGRNLVVDHVKNFRPPKEYLDIREGEEITADKLYKPSGPDGRGWGPFRDQTEEEAKFMEDQKRRLAEVKKRGVEKIKQMNEYKEKAMKNEEERWESMLMHQIEEVENKEILELQKKIKKAQKKRKKMKKKKKKKKKDKKKKKSKREE